VNIWQNPIEDMIPLRDLIRNDVGYIHKMYEDEFKLRKNFERALLKQLNERGNDG
jgi:hypothetical protein